MKKGGLILFGFLLYLTVPMIIVKSFGQLEHQGTGMYVWPAISELDGPPASPTPTPSPSPSPSPSPTPSAFPTVEMSCATYGLPNRDVASGDNFTTANTIGDNCKVVLTWWEQTAAQAWCPYIRGRAKNQYCGTYNNFRYMDGGSASEQTWNLGRQQYSYRPYYATCDANSCGKVLRGSTAVPVYNSWGNNNEKLMDAGDYGNSSKFIDMWFNDVLDLPDSSPFTPWTATAASASRNLVFLDNYAIWPIAYGGWNTTPLDPRRGGTYTRTNMETDAIAGMTHMKSLAATNSIKLFGNIASEMDLDYFSRGTAYPNWVSQVDYCLFEYWGNDVNGNPVNETYWTNRLAIAKDMIKNNRCEPIVNGHYGNKWYNLGMLLLVRENGKGMIYWQSSIPSAGDLTKLNNASCGTPTTDAYLVGSAYYRRDWTNCIILVNYKAASAGTVNLGGNYTNIETGATVSSVSMTAYTAYTLQAQ